MTNSDRIRQMTDEELADFFEAIEVPDCAVCSMHPVQCNYECHEGKLKWLKQEVDDA